MTPALQMRTFSLSVCFEIASAPCFTLAKDSRSMSMSVILPPCVLALISSTTFCPFSMLQTVNISTFLEMRRHLLAHCPEDMPTCSVQGSHRLDSDAPGYSCNEKDLVGEFAYQAFIFDDLKCRWSCIARSGSVLECLSVARHLCCGPEAVQEYEVSEDKGQEMVLAAQVQAGRK